MDTIASPGASNLAPPGSRVAIAQLGDVRSATLALVCHIDEQDLKRVHSPIMSPLVWDLGHIAAYEDLWLVHRHGGRELLHPDLADLYDAFETPRAVRGEIQALGPAQARDYMSAVSERTAQVLAERGTGDGVLYEMVLRHELQHSETMRQTMDIAGLLCAADRLRMHEPLAGHETRKGWLEVPAGTLELGADPDSFAYDNERPRHAVELPAFQIARRPVSNSSWLSFSEGGGYEQREWWSDEGWAWRQEQDAKRHPAIEEGDPQAPACHVCWFEADAFARAHGARLPTEAEWERAAKWTQLEGKRASELAGIGRVWEWTSSHFQGYPGFQAYPYREYSQVFFGERYRVLRGGSWATHPRVKTLTFRNWDLPQRRQIFAGVRLAREA
ncbi:MAG: SUMF1/EgtB/PvdO family nonheme iron enzyme [Solirubrobacteraceae bacterium]